MASNYMTSDGVDLDSRYLGINAKAKSAATADTVSGKSVYNKLGVNGSAEVVLSQAKVKKDITITIPSDMFVNLVLTGFGSEFVADGYQDTVTVKKDGAAIGSGACTHGDRPKNYSYVYNGFVKSGTKFSVSVSGAHASYVEREITGTGCPIVFYAIS